MIKKIFHATRRMIAAQWMKLQRGNQIAITGSQGKTNTTYILSKVLGALGKVNRTDTNLDTIYNVPITALRTRPWHKFIVWELGVNHPREMNHYLQIIRPGVAIVTGISPTHTDKAHLGSLDALIREKRKLIETLPKKGYAILNYDDPYVRDMAKFTKARILFYGTHPNKCDVWADQITTTQKGLTAVIHDGDHSFTLESSLIGSHQIYAIMASYLVSKIFQMRPDKFIKKIKDIAPLRGRMNIEPGPFETTLLNDSLRANPASVAAGLDTFDKFENKKGKKIAVLGEMGELQFPEEEHKKIGVLLAQTKIDYILGIGHLLKYTLDEAQNRGVSKDKLFYHDTIEDAAQTLRKIIKKGDMIYLKGSLSKHVDQIIPLMKKIK